MVFCNLYSNFNRKLCKQTVETLIRPRILWHLIWVCTVCLCPTKRTLGLYGLALDLTVEQLDAWRFHDNLQVCIYLVEKKRLFSIGNVADLEKRRTSLVTV